MNRYDKLVRNVGIIIFILMISTSVVLGNNNVDEGTSVTPQGPEMFEGIPIQRSTAAEGGTLTTGESNSLTISEEGGQVIKNFTVRLSWSDESTPPRLSLRRYENQPDSFSLRVKFPDGNSSDVQASNTIDQMGDLEITESIDDEYLAELMDRGIAGQGDWTVEVMLTSSGPWTPVRGPGLMDIPDGENEYSLSVDFEYYQFEPLAEEE